MNSMNSFEWKILDLKIFPGSVDFFIFYTYYYYAYNQYFY